MSLIDLIPQAEWERVMSSDASAEIDITSFTCLDYEPLAQMIPRHWTVIDFGCGYNAQSYLFKEHRRLISVDSGTNGSEFGWHFERFQPEWCEYHELSINQWIDQYFDTIDRAETFAICGWVPDRLSVKRVREMFTNLFVIYPSDKAYSRGPRPKVSIHPS